LNDVLTRQRIIEVAEDVFRRFGPQKTNVVDVARELGVSHGSVYRHFDSKAALRDAVVEVWLKRVSDPLQKIAGSDGPPDERLRQWFDALREIKRKKVQTDPQLSKVTREIFAEVRDVVKGHIHLLTGQLEHIIADGVAAGVFKAEDPAVTADAMFYAMSRFHDPAHADEWSEPGNDAAFERVYALVRAGLRP
jgi:AcrR family transcriptional regulator